MVRLDPLSVEERSERMGRVKSKNTLLELEVRRLIFSLGYRYRLHASNLPGNPDLVFRKKKKAIFIHGCFWHRHNCSSGKRVPKSRLDFWIPKLRENKKRDKAKQQALSKLGWTFLIIWECEIKNKETLVSRIKNFLSEC
jgi:DNA mismatch endonuclease (patch repair protein)